MNFEQTVELEANIKIKDRALEIYRNFKENVLLSPAKYRGSGKFEVWSDSHNAEYIVVHEDCFEYIGDYLHNKYNIKITLDSIFAAIKSKDRGIEHLEQLAISGRGASNGI